MRLSASDPIHTEPLEGAGWVLFGEQRAIPTSFRADVRLDDPRCLVRLHVVVDRGAPGVRAMSIEQELDGGQWTPAITSSVLRRVALDALLRQVVDDAAQVAVSVEVEGHQGVFQLKRDVEAGDNTTAWGGRPARSPLSGRGRRTSDDVLRQVAGIYRSARRAPTQAVADTLHVSRSHAGKLVGQARAAGHLGGTSQGKAGEQR